MFVARVCKALKSDRLNVGRCLIDFLSIELRVGGANFRACDQFKFANFNPFKLRGG